jgi:hypothetical protein
MKRHFEVTLEEAEQIFSDKVTHTTTSTAATATTEPPSKATALNIESSHTHYHNHYRKASCWTPTRA